MIEFLLALPTWIGCGLTMVFTTVLSLLVYIISNKLIGKSKNADLKEPINNLFRLVGIIVSLMLSLAFGEVIAGWHAIKNAIDREAAAISDTYTNLKYLDAKGTKEIRAVLVEYTQAVIDDEWPAMARDQLGQRTSELKRQFTKKTLEFKPTNSVQKEIRAHVLADIDTMSDYRLIRLNHSLAKPPVYILVIIVGFLVSMACFGAYQPNFSLIALVSLCTLFIGMVLYLILAMSDPFQGAVNIEPTPFEYLIEAFRSGMR